MRRLHLGCGHIIKTGWVNCDFAPLPGVDVVHNLNQFPWPWEDGTFDEVLMKDVLEHLEDTIGVMEELYRIACPGGKLHLAVPYWNSFEAITDPTHKKSFNEFTFDFFDPTHWRCKNRPYYSKARFKVERIGFVVAPFRPYLRIPVFSRERVIYNPVAKWFIGALASFMNNIIIGLEVHLERVADQT